MGCAVIATPRGGTEEVIIDPEHGWVVDGSSSAELADALNDLLTAVVDPRLVPPWLARRDRELLERSLRLAGMCELALDDGAATTALQAQRRADVLRPLLAVARHGAAAATEWWAR